MSHNNSSNSRYIWELAKSKHNVFSKVIIFKHLFILLYTYIDVLDPKQRLNNYFPMGNTLFHVYIETEDEHHHKVKKMKMCVE